MHWIKVEDRLPECVPVTNKSRCVVVWAENYGWSEGYYDHRRGMWVDTYNDYESRGVTHWLEITPPTTEGK